MPTKKKNFTFLKADFLQADATFEEQYEIYQAWQKDKSKNLILKMWVGWHMHYYKEDFYREFYKNAHVIYLHRKDIVSQAISGVLTKHGMKNLTNVQQSGLESIPLNLEPARDFEWKIQQLEKFIDNLPPIDNMIISESIFNEDSSIETLRSMYGIDFYKRDQESPDYLKKTLISNYNDIEESLIKHGYLARYQKVLTRLRIEIKKRQAIAFTTGRL